MKRSVSIRSDFPVLDLRLRLLCSHRYHRHVARRTGCNEPLGRAGCSSRLLAHRDEDHGSRQYAEKREEQKRVLLVPRALVVTCVQATRVRNTV